MLAPARSPLGAPGAYALPSQIAPALHPQRMDVCAFVGVAPRGPAFEPVVDERWPAGWRRVADVGRPRRRSVPVLLRSFDDYVRVFGGFEGPGALPEAVASYFEQGGRLAWVVRIVHARHAPLGDGCARGEVSGAFATPLAFMARNEGGWGQGLRVQCGFTATALAFWVGAGNEITVSLNAPVAVGSLLRLTDADGLATLVWCEDLQMVRDGLSPQARWRVVPDAPLVKPPVRAEVVEAWLAVDDGSGRSERFEHLALSANHPNSLASVLCDRSSLLWPHPDWAGMRLLPLDVRVERLRGTSDAFVGGIDAYGDLVAEDFFDDAWSAAADEPGSGLMALAPVDGQGGGGVKGLVGGGPGPDASAVRITQLVVPDLYVPAQWAGEDTVPERITGGAGASFGPCVDVLTQPAASAVPPSALTGLILDPRRAADLDTIGVLQARVVDFCEATQGLIALLDVPPGLSQSRIEQWRARFDTSWAAAYHPWLQPARRQDEDLDSARSRPRVVPPSAVAAGIVARRELDLGIQYGPANETARQVIKLLEDQPRGRVDALHPLGLNCFVREAAGITLVSARTLSRERDWRQLSVRRLMLMLRRTLLIDTQWAVFEPNGPTLWRDLRHAIDGLLRGLYRVGMFAGRTEAESFFVRLLDEPWRLDRGELLIEIGVAPAEPLEFILVRLRRDGDGTLNLEG